MPINIQKEKEKMKLNFETDCFATKMKLRLFEKVNEGYTGWNDESIMDDIAYDMELDARAVDELVSIGEMPNKKVLIDIACRAMI